MVAFNATAIETHNSDGTSRLYSYDGYGNAGYIIVDDIDITINSREKFRHYGATFSVAGSTFSIAIKESKNSMKFYIDNESHTRDKDIEGLLGFTMAQSYTINNDNTMTINGEQMQYSFDSAEDCYRIDTKDVYQKLVKHQMGQHYLLGRPIQAQLL